MLNGNKIAGGEAEYYLPLNLTRAKFVPEISRLTVLLMINTIASLLFVSNVLVLPWLTANKLYISDFHYLDQIMLSRLP